MTAVLPEHRRTGPAAATEDLRALVAVALDALAAGRAARPGPLPAGGPGRVQARLDDAVGPEVLPTTGRGAAAALTAVLTAFAEASVDPADPWCAAHLHCPPAPEALAADLVASALNQSLDSWDQGPAAVELERRVVAALAALAGFPDGAGALTTGGTGSTYTALLLARDAAPGPVAVYAGADAHFCAHRGARLLGLPPVRTVPSGPDRAMDPAALRAALAAAPPAERPVVVATAGTTDLGIVDPLADLAGIVHEVGGWLHVDAAYGGGLLFSAARRAVLAGLERADSVALDLHKFGWQPAAAGVLLTARQEAFAPLARRAAYLNPDDDEAAGYLGLLGRSLRTTRRADAVRVAVSFLALGVEGLGARVDACCDLAAAAADLVTARPELELVERPRLSTVLFRYRTADPARSDAVNARLRRDLLDAGRAVVGRTEIDGAVRLKLTLLNPDATEADVAALLDVVVAAGHAAEAALGGAR